MNSKPSRNQLFNYASQKKHTNKNCSTPLSSSSRLANVVDFTWYKLCKQKSAVIDHSLISSLLETFTKEVMGSALDDYFQEDLPKELDQDLLFCQWSLPWILFNGILHNNFELNHFNPHTTSDENVLIHHPTTVSEEEQRLIKAMLTTDCNSYVILTVVKDQELLVKDLLLISEDRLKEQQATQFLKQGNIVFRKILTLHNQFLFIGVAPFRSPEHHFDLLAFRKWLITKNDDQPLDGNALRNCLDRYLHQYFLNELMQSLEQPRPSWVNAHSDFIGDASKTKLFRNLLVTSSCLLKQFPAWSVADFL